MNRDVQEERRRQMQVAIGQAVRARRRSLGLAQADLAARVFTHRPLVARVERGTHELLLGTLVRYATALEYTVAQLVADAERHAGVKETPVPPACLQQLELGESAEWRGRGQAEGYGLDA